MAAGDPIVGCGESWVPWSSQVRFGERGPLSASNGTHVKILQQIRLNVKKPPRLRDLTGQLPYSDHAASAGGILQ